MKPKRTYKLVWANEYEPFEIECTKMLNDGWEFFGPSIINEGLNSTDSISDDWKWYSFWQPFVKYEDDDSIIGD